MATPKKKRAGKRTSKKKVASSNGAAHKPKSPLPIPPEGKARVPVAALDPDQKIITRIETELIALNARAMDLLIQHKQTVAQAERLREQYHARIREAGANAGIDMNLNWHFDAPSMTFHPRQ